MRRMKKSKKVSWASDLSLRQEKLFLSEDPPSQVAQRPQNQLQVKQKATLFPYRLQVAQPSSQMRLRKPAIGFPKWQCPPTFQLMPNWLNVAGEESKERPVQNQRERSVLEAFYPHPSAIPPNPVVSSEVRCSYYDDLLTPVIRITPIEDDEEEVVNPLKEPVNIGISSQPSTLTQLERNLVTPASSVMPTSAKQEETLIDLELLVKILSNPKMLGTLITTDLESAAKPSSPPTVNFSAPNSFAAPVMNVAASMMNTVAPLSNPNLHPHGFSHISTTPVVDSCPTNPQLKDIDYYKSLIQQHGIEKPKGQGQKLQKFGKNNRKRPNSRGSAWKGESNYAAAYQPDISFGQRFSSITIPQVHCAKRVKLNQEILGRT